MATNEGSSYTLITNSEFASEEWELNEAFRRSETEELPIESSAAIEAPLDCITSITNSNSETQIVDAIALDHVYHRKNSDAAPTVTECQPGLESPTCISLPELPILSNPKPALGDPINRPMGSKSPTKSSSILHSLHMDVKLAEPDNDHQGQNNNSARPESITSSHSLQRDSELAKPDSNCHLYNSNIEKEHNRPGPREQEEFLHQPFILGPVDDLEKESNIEVNLLAPESYTTMVQQCFQEVNDTKSNGTNLQDPLQTKQPEETLQFGQEHTPQSNDVSLPPCQVVLSHKTLKSQASAMSSINDLSGHKLAKILRRDFRREVESFCVSYSNACVKKDKLMSGDDRDRGLCSEPGHCSVSTTMAEAHGPIPQEGIQYHESGPLVLDKLPLFSCKQCGSFFESEAILGHHHKLCLGVIVCESCMVIFAYKDALANLIPPGFVCKDCGLSFPSDCEHKRTDQLPWFKACLCQSDPKAKFFLGHRRACTLCNVFLQFPRMCNTCKCTKRRNVTNKQVSSRKKLLRGEWSVKAIKCCKCNITFMTLLNFVQHLQLKDGTDDNLDSSLSTGGLCVKSNNVFTCKEHVQNHDCIVAPPKERPAAKKPMKKALLSAESTDCPKQRQRKIDGRLRKWEGRLDHTYSAEHSMKPTMCKLCRTFFSNHLLLEEHNKWHLLKDASVGSEKPSIRCLLEQYIESFKQTNEVDSQLHTMANVPKETSINPPVKPSTLCLPKVRKAAQDTERILQSSKKKAFDQLQQTQSTENIKQTSEKTDSQLHTMANVPKETSINPPVKPSTLCLQKVRKAAQDAERILQSSKKNAFDQLQQTQSTENIKQTSEKTDCQLHTMANVPNETSINPPVKPSTLCLQKVRKAAQDAERILQSSKKNAFDQLQQTQSTENIKQTSEKTDCQLHTMANVPKETSINPPVKPSTLCLQKVRKASQDTERILQSSKKNAFDQLQQTQSTENIKQTSEKTDSQLHTMANVFDETSFSPLKLSTTCLLKQPTGSIEKIPEGTTQSLLLWDMFRPDEKHPSKCLYHISRDKTALRDDGQSYVLGNIFQCIWCKKYFSLLKSFKQHKCKKKPGRTNPHLLINTYLCEYCGLSFAQHGNFMKHIVLHNDVQAGYELQQTQPIVNIKQTSKNTDSRPHAIESVLQELHVSPQKQSALSQLKQPKEIIKQTSVRSDSQRHQQQHLSTLSRPDYVPEDKMALRNNNTSCMIGKTPQCVWCKAYFGCQESFKQHECKVIPVRTQAYLCEYCGFFFKLLDNFTKHMALHRCMQLDRCSPVLDSADTSDSIPETSNSCNRTTPFQCPTCSKAFAFESQLLRHKNLHRLESRRPVPKRERSELESGDESFGNKVKKVQSGKKGSRGEERFGWKFRIKGPDCETGSGTRRRGTGGKGNLQEGPKSAPRWGRKARAKVINVKHFFCSACNQGFYHPWQLRKHIALHSEFSCYKCNGLVFSSMSELNNHLFSGKHNEQVQSARHEKHGPESSAPQGNSAPSTPKELESVQSGYPKGRKISSMATGLKSVQSGKSRTSSRFSISQKIDLAPSGQSKGRTKTLSDKKMKSVQSGQRIGSNKSSKDKKIKSVRHGHSITKKDFSSRTKECSQIAPDVSATEPMVSAVETKRIYCNQCGKGFLQTCKLNFHMLTCSEFKCDKCDGLTFPSNAQLKIHMRAHTDQYKCPKCDAQFASQKILTDHTASHSDPVPHICDVCELAFNSLKSLKMHKIIYHF